MKGNVRPKKTIHPSAERHPINIQCVIPDFNNSFPSSCGRNHMGSSDSKNIEKAYVANLEKQVHFYELEIKYLKERLEENEKKSNQVDAQDMKTKIMMLQKQAENFSREMETKSTETATILKDAKEEKTKLLLEISDLQSQIMSLTERSQHREAEFESLRADLVNECEKQHEMQETINNLRAIRQESDENQNDEGSAEKAEENATNEQDGDEGEEEDMKDKFIDSLRSEITSLREKLAVAEFEIEKKKDVERKLEESCSCLIKEKVELSQRIFELAQQLNHEKEARDLSENKSCNNLRSELEQVREKSNEMALLHQEELKNTQILNKRISELEKRLKRKEVHLKEQKIHSREMGNLAVSLENTNLVMRRDKTLLTENIGDLKSEIEAKNNKIRSLEDELAARLESSQESKRHSERLKELSHIAHKLKELSN